MKIVRFRTENRKLWGILNEEEKRIYSNVELAKEIDCFEKVMEYVQNSIDKLKDQYDLDNVQLLAPVLPTKNILCIGKNYYEHILEFDGTADDVERVKETPIFFSKALSSLTGHGSAIYLNENACKDVDYEAELAVVIGKKGTNIKREDALQYVYGYTILNDVTARDLQSNHQQWFKGKSLDSHCPVGPWIVTKDEIKDGNNLNIRSTINGEVRQDANTKLMIHDIPALIEWLSRGMTLNAGDIIATGTPKGVGKGFNPPKYLKAGDKVEVYVEKIGTLFNSVEASI